jgi:hypothetical protein
VRNSPDSLCPLPAYRPIPSPTTAPQAREKTAANRASGNPRPGFWLSGCGYSAWFAVVSGMEVCDPSYTYTRRPFQSHRGSTPASSTRPVWRAMSAMNCSGNRWRAWQYAPVRAEHGGWPRDARWAFSRATAARHDGSALRTWPRNTQRVTSGV